MDDRLRKEAPLEPEVLRRMQSRVDEIIKGEVKAKVKVKAEEQALNYISPP